MSKVKESFSNPVELNVKNADKSLAFKSEYKEAKLAASPEVEAAKKKITEALKVLSTQQIIEVMAQDSSLDEVMAEVRKNETEDFHAANKKIFTKEVVENLEKFLDVAELSVYLNHKIGMQIPAWVNPSCVDSLTSRMRRRI